MKDEFLKIPTNRFFKFSLVSCSDGRAEVAMPIDESYLQEGNVVHGGIISTLADTTAVYAILPKLPDGKTMASIEFKVNFLAPALMHDGQLKASSLLLKQGRNVAVCEVEVHQKQKLVAKGMFTYLLYESKPSRAT